MFRPCSHFANRWPLHFKIIFVADKVCVHTALMLSVTLIRAIPLCSKKSASEAIFGIDQPSDDALCNLSVPGFLILQ